MKMKQNDIIDDGRTIVDMSDVEKPNLLSFRPFNQEEQQSYTSPKETYTKEQRRWAIFGALKASLLIGLAYVVGFGLLILFMVLWFLK